MAETGTGALDGSGSHAIEVSSLTDVGRQRAQNQDAFLEVCRSDGTLVLMVADGMGGHAAGETASLTAVETVRSVVEGAPAASETLLQEALEAANHAIHELARSDAKLHGMGTTGVALLLAPDGRASLAHVGDSRAYRLRDGSFEQLTHDHSFVAEMQRRGLIDAAEAAVHPRRHQVLRSLGVEPGVDVELQQLDVEPDDCFLLCSDGLSGVVSDAEIAERVAGQPLADAARNLVELANERGGPDNITVQIVRLSPGGGPGAGLLRQVGIVAVGAALLAAAWALLAR